MAQFAKEDIQKAGGHVGRSPRTIRRWAACGIDIRDITQLETCAKQSSDRTFGRYGDGARLLGAKGGSKTSEAKRQASQQNGKRGGRPKGLGSVANAVFNCDAWQISPRNVIFSRTPSTEEWRLIFEYLRVSGNWFHIGSALAELSRKLREEYTADEQWLEGMRATYRGIKGFDEDVAVNKRLAEKLKVTTSVFDDRYKAKEAMHVCEALGQHRFKLSWRHHRDAVAECGKANGAEAIEWLHQADENQWTVSQMRAEIRRSQATYSARQDTAKTATLTSAIRHLSDHVKAVVSTRPIEQWSDLEVCAFMQDAEPVLQFLRALQTRMRQSEAAFEFYTA
jgi:hypothetical protein